MVLRATSDGGGLAGSPSSYARSPLVDDLDANEYDITDIGTLSLIVNGLCHLNGGTPAAAPSLAAPPVIGGALLSDVLTWVTDTTTWLAALRTALIARGVIKAP